MPAYQTDAIILKREDAFEADRIYHIYTRDFGKVRALATGVRKINAKLSGHLEPFNLAWVELMSKKGGNMFITTALSEGPLLTADVSPNRIALFTKMAEFSMMMLKEPQKDEALWNYMLDNFLAANRVEPGGGDEFLNKYKSGFLKIMGFGDNFEEARYYLGDFL